MRTLWLRYWICMAAGLVICFLVKGRLFSEVTVRCKKINVSARRLVWTRKTRARAFTITRFIFQIVNDFNLEIRRRICPARLFLKTIFKCFAYESANLVLTTDRYWCAPSKFFNSRRHALKLYLVTSSAHTLAASCLLVAGWTAVTNTYGALVKGWKRRNKKI